MSVILVFAYFIADQRVEEQQAGHFNVILYDNVEMIQKDSELVIEAIITTNSKEIINKTGEFLEGFTFTDVKIDKVIKDESKQNNGTIVTVIEPVFTIDNGIVPGKTQMVMDDYRKMVPEAKYILFLNWSEEKHAYWIHALHQGKVNIDGKDAKEQLLASNNVMYQKLRNSVIDKHVR
jgi:hypothetical protein